MKFTLGKKLGLGFSAVLVLMIVSAVLSCMKASEIRGIEEVILNVRVPTINNLRLLQDDLDYCGAKARQTILAGTNPTRKAAGQKAFDEAWTRVDRELAKLEILSPQWLPENRVRLAQIKKDLPNVRATQQTTMDTASSGGRDAVIQGGDDYMDRVTPVLNANTKLLGEIADVGEKRLADSNATLASANHSLTWTMAIATLLALAVGIFVAPT